MNAEEQVDETGRVSETEEAKESKSGTTRREGNERYKQARAENSQENQSQVEANFQSFLAGLYTQTLASLGAVEETASGSRNQDLQQARYLIDTLGILKEKTDGNLESSEETYFMNLLQDLRMRYVQAVESKQGEGETTDSSQ